MDTADSESLFALREERLLTCCGGIEWIFHTEQGWIAECGVCGRTGEPQETPRRAAQAWRVMLAGLRGFTVRLDRSAMERAQREKLFAEFGAMERAELAELLSNCFEGERSRAVLEGMEKAALVWLLVDAAMPIRRN